MTPKSCRPAATGRAVAAITIGDPLDPATEMGPLVSAAQCSHVMAHIARAQAEGARHGAFIPRA